MIVEDLDAMYEETYKKNDEIQTLLVEVKDYNEILNFLYETDIQRPNLTLNSMIDTYESAILKLRELHKNITNSLEEFGQEQALARAISDNDALAEKVKELMLWKLRRIYMIYDREPILPYIEGKIVNVTLINDTKAAGSNPGNQNASNNTDSAIEEEEMELNPEGDLFPNSGNKTPSGNPR